MTNQNLQIRIFEPGDTEAVNSLIRGIQEHEFGFTEQEFPQPELYDIQNFYIERGGNFWVATLDHHVIGTVGIVNLGQGVAKLGRMFVAPEHRGKPLSLAHRLLQTAESWAKSVQINMICFETTPDPCAAHVFYKKHGYNQVQKSEFPEIFEFCPYPSLYFLKKF